MTAKKRNRNLAKKGKKASASDDPATAAAAAANQGEKATVDEAQLQLQQLQIGNDDNTSTTTTCSHGLFLPHDAIDKMKETLTKQVLASCDDLALAKTPCDFQAIDRFIVGDCGADLVSSPYPSSKGLMTLITSYFEKLMEEKEPNIEKMGVVIVMFFAHMDHEDKVTSTAISQWVPSHFVAAGARCLIQGDVETARAYAYFNCYFEQLGSLLKQKKQFDITKMIEMRNADVRTIVSYFRKRIPCSCLDRRYKEVKSAKKIGFCFNPICSNIPDPKSVLCCSRCRQANYCSSACQAADWNFHKKVCVQFKNVKSAIKEVTGDMNDASMTYEDFKKKEYFKDCNEQTIFDTVKKNFEENTESSVREIGTG